MAIQRSVFLGALVALLPLGVAAQTLGLEQHLQQGTVWRRISESTPNSDCPEYFRLTDRSAYVSNESNEDFRPGDMAIGLSGFRFDEQTRERSDYGRDWSWSYRPSLVRGRATLEDNFAFYFGTVSNRATQGNRGNVLQLEYRLNASSMMMSSRIERRLSYDRASGSIEIFGRENDRADNRCRYEITELPRPPVAVDDSARGEAPVKPDASEAQALDPAAQQE